MPKIREEDIERGWHLGGKFAFVPINLDKADEDMKYAVASCNRCGTEWKIENPESGDFSNLECPHCGKKDAEDTGIRMD